jgi:hypothetical protein
MKQRGLIYSGDRVVGCLGNLGIAAYQGYVIEGLSRDLREFGALRTEIPAYAWMTSKSALLLDRHGARAPRR